jgi:hypothetical protein
MSQTLPSNTPRWVPPLAAGLASFFVLSGLFVATMLLQYQSVDFAYLSFALLRIVAISVLVAAIAFIAGSWLRSLVFAALFGTVGGLIGGVVFVAAAA